MEVKMKKILFVALLAIGLMTIVSCGGGGGGSSSTNDTPSTTDSTARDNIVAVYGLLDAQEQQDFSTILYNMNNDYVEGALVDIRDGVAGGLDSADIINAVGSVVRANPFAVDSTEYQLFEAVVSALQDLAANSETLYLALENIIDDIDDATLEAIGLVIDDAEGDGFDAYAADVAEELETILAEEGIETEEAEGVVVDPYIEGAVFCIDENTNNLCDSDEPRSTASDANGAFTFAVEPEDGAVILMDISGEHNGVPYAFDGLMGVYEGDGIVVSPITTFYAAGLTANQIMEMFTVAGLQNIQEEYLFTNPMEDLISDEGTVSEESLAVLRSSLMSYMLFRVLDGSEALAALTAQEVYASAITDGSPVNEILTAMATVINQSLSQSTLNLLDATGAMLASFGFPDIEFDDVVRTAVTIADKLSEIGYDTCNATDGDVAQALTAVEDFITNTTTVGTLIEDLGPAYYMARIKNQLSAQQQAGAIAANADYETFLTCDSNSFIIEDDGSYSCYVAAN